MQTVTPAEMGAWLSLTALSGSAGPAHKKEAEKH